jgi:hypothetical protein
MHPPVFFRFIGGHDWWKTTNNQKKSFQGETSIKTGRWTDAYSSSFQQQHGDDQERVVRLKSQSHSFFSPKPPLREEWLCLYLIGIFGHANDEQGRIHR